MPAPHDLDPPAMTDEERRAKRRYQAGHAFEQMPGPLECGSVMPGHNPGSPLHYCHRRPHADSRHDAPVTVDPGSRFVGLSVSWHDPMVEWSDDAQQP
jgi:hypothetical protein